MTLRKHLAQDEELLPVLKLIPELATDEQIYFYMWVQKDTIAARVPVPASYDQRYVQTLKDWIAANVEDPTDYTALLKLRPLSYTSNNFGELLKYCANRKKIFDPEMIKKVEARLGFTTPEILYDLLEKIKGCPVYQQYALAVTYEHSFYNINIFLNFVTDGPTPPDGETLRGRWAKWADTFPRIAGGQKPTPPKIDFPLKPMYIPPPNVTRSARTGSSITSKRQELSTIRIGNPQKTAGAGIKMRTDQCTKPLLETPRSKPQESTVVDNEPTPSEPLEPVVLKENEPTISQTITVANAELQKRIETESNERCQLKDFLSARQEHLQKRIDTEFSTQESLERLQKHIEDEFSTRETVEHLRGCLEEESLQRYRLEESLVSRQTHFEKHAELESLQRDSLEELLATELAQQEQLQQHLAEQLSLQVDGIKRSQKRAKTDLLAQLESMAGVHKKLAVRIESIECLQGLAHEGFTARLDSIECTQDLAQRDISTQLESTHQGIKEYSERLYTELVDLIERLDSTENELTARLASMDHTQKCAEEEYLQIEKVLTEELTARVNSIQYLQQCAVEDSLQRDTLLTKDLTERLDQLQQRTERGEELLVKEFSTQLEHLQKHTKENSLQQVEFSAQLEHLQQYTKEQEESLSKTLSIQKDIEEKSLQRVATQMEQLQKHTKEREALLIKELSVRLGSIENLQKRTKEEIQQREAVLAKELSTRLKTMENLQKRTIEETLQRETILAKELSTHVLLLHKRAQEESIERETLLTDEMSTRIESIQDSKVEMTTRLDSIEETLKHDPKNLVEQLDQLEQHVDSTALQRDSLWKTQLDQLQQHVDTTSQQRDSLWTERLDQLQQHVDSTVQQRDSLWKTQLDQLQQHIDTTSQQRDSLWTERLDQLQQHVDSTVQQRDSLWTERLDQLQQHVDSTSQQRGALLATELTERLEKMQQEVNELATRFDQFPQEKELVKRVDQMQQRVEEDSRKVVTLQSDRLASIEKSIDILTKKLEATMYKEQKIEGQMETLLKPSAEFAGVYPYNTLRVEKPRAESIQKITDTVKVMLLHELLLRYQKA